MAILTTVSVTDALVQRLTEKVLDGELVPGAPIGELDVANEFGVSRPTAKAAITTLVHDGLLRRDAHRSARVPELTADDVRDVYRVRIPLELEVVAALATRGEVSALTDEAFAELGRLAEDVQQSVFIEADLHAHRSLIEQYGSPRMSRVYNSLSGEIHLSMMQSRRALGHNRLTHEHGEVLEAIRRGDVDGAVGQMRSHLEGSRDAIAAAISAQRELSAGDVAEPTTAG